MSNSKRTATRSKKQPAAPSKPARRAAPKPAPRDQAIRRARLILAVVSDIFQAQRFAVAKMWRFSDPTMEHADKAAIFAQLTETLGEVERNVLCIRQHAREIAGEQAPAPTGRVGGGDFT